VAVAGNIATGKSTLVAALASALSLPQYVEHPDQNPWFDRVSGDPTRWSLHAELDFLCRAVQSQHHLVGGQRGGVLERLPAEHIEVFGRARRDRQWLAQDEFELLHAIWRQLSPRLEEGRPDILLVLHAPAAELLVRVRERDRRSEHVLDERTLNDLEALYESFVRSWDSSPIVEIDTGAHDVRSPLGVAHVLSRINATLGGSTS
jgi:deoxyadenosine/deoxycytidine kinase